MGHNCILCGTVLPNRKGGRCYCKPCGEYMRAERNRKGNEERKELRVLREIAPKPKPAYIQPSAISKTDEAYCKGCFYHNTHNDAYLCNYIIKTGHKRGCPAGVGCNKRRKQS